MRLLHSYMMASMARNAPVGGPQPILIVDDILPHLSTLPQILDKSVAACHFDLSSSYEHAQDQIRTKRYHAVLSNVRYAAMRNFSLIDLNQSFQPSTQFIVTASQKEGELASEALKRSSVDLITTPFDEHEATAVVQIALWLYQLRRTIEHKEERLAVLRRQREMLSRILPHDLERAQDVERDLRSEGKSLDLLIGAARKLAQGSHQRAWATLHSLLKKSQS